jgi:1-aminocyclopropane-1-carboxylate deaminase
VKNQIDVISRDFNFLKKDTDRTPTIRIEDPILADSGINLLVKREDMIHPYLSGNKFYKLKYNLEEARNRGHDTLLTFGGAYSNHIYATAAAGKIYNFNTIGIIRGEERKPLNPTLNFCKKCGMILFYLDRETYRNKTNSDVIKSLMEKFGRFYIIPEGGSNALAVKGCTEIISSIEDDFDYICTAAGTGGTIAGLAAGLNGNKRVLGFSVLKGGNFLNGRISELIISYYGRELNNWQLNHEYHFGGYAKFNLRLLNFIEYFQQQFNIPLEPIYSGKMLYGIFDLVKTGFFPPGTTIIAVHTGGLQGLRGLADKINRVKNRSEKQI